MTCPVWQRMLDEAASDTEALDTHALSCPACFPFLAEQRLFLRALPLDPPALPAGFGSRVCSAILADRPGRPWLRRAAPHAALIAAALLLAVGLRLGVKPPTAPPAVAQAEAPDLRGSVNRATLAVADAASSTASATVQEAARLLPPMGVLEPGPLPEPGLGPLVGAADEVRDGLAPVADSARRAVNLFFRDLPTGRNPG